MATRREVLGLLVEDDWVSKLETLGVLRRDCDLGLKLEVRRSSRIGDEEVLWAGVVRFGERGNLSSVMGWDKTRLNDGRMTSGVCGVVGQPWIWSQQSSQTRESTIGEMGDSNAEMGMFLGGWRMSRLEASSRGVVRAVHAPQKTPPHLRQCCRCVR